MSSTLPPPEEPAPDDKDVEQLTWLSQHGTPEWTLPLHEMPELPKDYEPPAGTEIMPIVVFHNYLYLPFSRPPLTIIESRYKQMYEMILSSKVTDPKLSRKFVAVLIDDDSRLLTTGVLVHVTDVAAVEADETRPRDQKQPVPKFAARYIAIGRMKLVNVLNPEEAKSQETFLWAEVAEKIDDEPTDTAAEEEALSALMLEVVVAQESLDDGSPRFQAAVKQSLEQKTLQFGAGAGSWHTPEKKWQLTDMGLWGSIQLWQRLLDERSHAMSAEMHGENKKIIAEYYAAHPKLKKPEGHLYLEDLPEELQIQVNVVRMRYKENADAFSPRGPPFQMMLQTTEHSTRLAILRDMFKEELSRLKTRAQLKALCKNLGNSGDQRRLNALAAPAEWQLLGPAAAAGDRLVGPPRNDDEFAGSVLPASEQSAWESEWRRRLGCWYTALPLPSQSHLQACLGALGMHIGSRLDAAWRGANALLGSQPAAPSAQPGCEWLSDERQLELPAFPDFPSSLDFTLPPIPSLLPDWRQLQSRASDHWPISQPLVDAAATGAGAQPRSHASYDSPVLQPLARTDTTGEPQWLAVASGGVAGGVVAAGFVVLCLRGTNSLRGRASAGRPAVIRKQPPRVDLSA